MSAALTVRNLTVEFGGLIANDRVSLEVRRGQVVGLIGPNGAGKSTFVDAASGFVKASGDVMLEGRSVAGLAPHRRARLGLTRTWQSVELFDDITARGNVEVANRQVTSWSFVRDIVRPTRAPDERVDQLLGTLDLLDVADTKPPELSLGDRKRLGVARALAGSPVVTLLDEPASGLDPSERGLLGSTIRRLADDGLAFLLIEHDVDMVMSICDWVVVLAAGAVIGSGPPSKIRDDAAVAAAYLGADDAKGTA